MPQVKKFKVGIEITDTPENVQTLGNLIQSAVSNVDNQDIIALLDKVKAKPSLVKSALKWL